MKRILIILTFGMFLLHPVLAQNYRVKTDSIFDIEMEELRNAPKPAYHVCINSLIQYVSDHFGDKAKCSSSSNYRQVTVSLNGDDERLRQVTKHIIEQLSHFSSLQQYSELKDEEDDLRGRYIVKFSPEGNDTSAYAFLKYDRNLLLLRYSRNLAFELPKKIAPGSSPADEELSLWYQLKGRYDMICMGDKDVKIQYRRYHEGGPKPLFMTTPAPAENALTKMELLRVVDKDAMRFNFLRECMVLAGREKGTVYGKQTCKDQRLVKKDTCQYYYACHTFANHLSELIGVTREDSITYVVRATSDESGLCVNPWGWIHWMSNEELKALVISDSRLLGIWVYDAKTKKSLNKARVTTTDDKGEVVDLFDPFPQRPWAAYMVYRYYCEVQHRPHYFFKIEADGYETAYAEMTLRDDEKSQQIEVYLTPIDSSQK